jgi:hypothetical protein
MSDLDEPSGNGKPKHRPSWFRWNFDDFIAETDHLNDPEFTAATRLMGAMWRSEDCSLPDDPRTLARIAKGRSGVRFRWDRLNLAALETVLTFKDGRVTCPWLGRKWAQAGLALGRKWADATDNPLKNKTPTSPNRECRMHNTESKATTAAKARSLAKEKEASSGEQVEKPLTPDEKAERLAKVEAYKASQKREAVKQNLGITEGNIAPYTEVSEDEHEDDEGGVENDAGGTAA